MKALSLGLATAITLLVSSACANVPQTSTAMPNGREITAFVRANWSDTFELRVAYATDRQGQASTLLSLEDVECRPSEGHILCTFGSKVRFADGKVMIIPLEGHFLRTPDGGLEEMIRIALPPS